MGSLMGTPCIGPRGQWRLPNVSYDPLSNNYWIDEVNVASDSLRILQHYSTIDASRILNFSFTTFMEEENTSMDYEEFTEGFYQWWVSKMWGPSRDTDLDRAIDRLQQERFFGFVTDWLDAQNDMTLAGLGGKHVTITDYKTELFTISVVSDGYRIPFGVTRIIEEPKSFDEAIVTLRNAAPKWVGIQVVKGGIRFKTDRGGLYADLVATMPKIPVSGKAQDRVISNRALARAISRLEDVRSTLLKSLRGDMKQRMNQDTRTRKPVRSGKGNIDAFVSKLGASRFSEEKIIPKFEVPAHGFKSSRSWGIEVEVSGALGVKRQPGWGAKGDGSLYSPYDEHRNSHESGTWEPDTCEACKIAYPASMNGDSECREFVSPILSSFHSRGLEAMMVQINTQPQNDSAGVHVHVGVDDLTVKQIGSLVYGYSVIEPLIESSYERETREYCKNRETRELVKIGQSVKELMRSNQPFSRDSIYQGDRYVSLNLCAIEAHGTVEFRAMGPVYNYDTLIRWAYFCREMVNVAKAGVSFSEWNSIDSFDKLKSLFIRKGKESTEILMELIDSDSIKESLERNQDNINSRDWPELAVIGGEI